MLYLDTSLLVALFVREPASEAAERWLEQVDPDAVASSGWTVAEFVSAVGAKVRSRALSGAQGMAVVRRFASFVAASLRTIEPTADDFVRAASMMERFELGLRAGDALHVAIARRSNAAAIVTLDKALARAAEGLGLRAESPA